MTRLRAGALAAFVAAAALPVLAWHNVAERFASDFRLQLGYLISSWSGFALIALGLACLIPVVISVGLKPDSRLYPRSRRALTAWGTSLYLLGLGLSVQIAQIASVT